MSTQLPTVLTIAGSDSSGGAGIEGSQATSCFPHFAARKNKNKNRVSNPARTTADLKVITAHGCYGMTTITALTAQNTTAVKAIHLVPAEHVRKSLDAVFEDIPVDVVKTGMLGSVETIDVIVEAVAKYGVKKIVVDPVSPPQSHTRSVVITILGLRS
jgi:hydroxymethylpyrimidine/phosphomethylpyrimidine kinase